MNRPNDPRGAFRNPGSLVFTITASLVTPDGNALDHQWSLRYTPGPHGATFLTVHNPDSTIECDPRYQPYIPIHGCWFWPTQFCDPRNPFGQYPPAFGPPQAYGYYHQQPGQRQLYGPAPQAHGIPPAAGLPGMPDQAQYRYEQAQYRYYQALQYAAQVNAQNPLPGPGMFPLPPQGPHQQQPVRPQQDDMPPPAYDGLPVAQLPPQANNHQQPALAYPAAHQDGQLPQPVQVQQAPDRNVPQQAAVQLPAAQIPAAQIPAAHNSAARPSASQGAARRPAALAPKSTGVKKPALQESGKRRSARLRGAFKVFAENDSEEKDGDNNINGESSVDQEEEEDGEDEYDEDEADHEEGAGE